MEQKHLIGPVASIVKRETLPTYKAIIIRIATFIVTFLFAMFLCFCVIKQNYFEIIGTLFKGAFSRPWKLALDACLLLGFSIAILPAFKMKYWNMGANGQVLVGALVAVLIMFYLNQFGAKSSFNKVLVLIFMFIGCVVASILWAVIPALFKVFFNTNETLFTLMMNYIAAGLVGYVNYLLAQGKKENPGIINSATRVGWFPVLINKYFFPIAIIILIAVIIAFYMSKTKHGYEISVVGDSINTAKYVGMNTKKIIIRTLALSGFICGIIGFLYASAINQSVNKELCGSLGFTAVLICWLSNFNPLVMGGVSFLLAFLTNGTSKVSAVYRLGSNNLSSVIIGLIFFSILISEFFIRYQIKIRGLSKKGGKKQC
jgi:ABC-type uncharacterized transport system permease subunit